MTVCESKVFYDTEFEAQIGAARHDEEMTPYQCGTHWHIAHKDPKKSYGYGHKNKYYRCRSCLFIMPKSQAKSHICRNIKSTLQITNPHANVNRSLKP